MADDLQPGDYVEWALETPPNYNPNIARTGRVVRLAGNRQVIVIRTGLVTEESWNREAWRKASKVKGGRDE
jgi:hypothetical protein